MTRKSPYPTRADYPALIENAKPALRELLEAASYERRIAVLNECSLDVINTVCTIMVLGRHSLYQRRRKPFTAPDAVFVGGSGGELEDIFKIILKKNPHVRIVITAVTLETVQEAVRLLEQNGFDTPQIVQIAVTEVKKRGQYHMLSANNPVFIIEGSSVR